jgi:hypothetical protein
MTEIFTTPMPAPAMTQSSDTWMHDNKQTMRSAFHELTAPPMDTIKMLNNGEKDKLSLLLHADTHAMALYRSLFRGVVFSPGAKPADTSFARSTG